MFIISAVSSFLSAYKYSKSSNDENSFWVFLIIIAIIILLVIFFIIKSIVWDEPHKQINDLKKQIDSLNMQIIELNILHDKEKEALVNDIKLSQELHKKQLDILYEKIDKGIDVEAQFIKQEYADIVSCFAIKEIYELCHKEYVFLGIPNRQTLRGLQQGGVVDKLIQERFIDAIEEQYKYKLLTILYPKLVDIFDGVKINIDINKNIYKNLFDLVNSCYNTNSNIIQKQEKEIKLLKKQKLQSNGTIEPHINEINKLKKEHINEINMLKDEQSCETALLKNRVSFLEASQSNLTAIPYMSQIMADYETYGLEHLAKELDWGRSCERLKKVKSIREIRKDAKAMVEKNKESQYQLAYLLELFPALQDIIECEYKQLPAIKVEELSEYDATRDYLSKEEYQKLSVTERNQLALDRYKNSHNKSKWQIGRDYELYIGHQYELKGYNVDYFGSYMGLEDLGRDLIAKKDGKILIIQCKYWSSKKLIHEKHITQLYGTMMSYCVENNCKKTDVSGVLVTNITLSDTAKTMSKFLKIEYKENVELGDYPCIKCNINHNEHGETKIYHLPFDQKYDVTKIDRKGEFYATTVVEAEAAGFRRAFKWFGS